MLVSKIESGARASFLVAVIEASFGGRWATVRDFGLAQICRVRPPLGAVLAPVFDERSPQEAIKRVTLNGNNYFLDHFVRVNDQGLLDDTQRYCYYMDSFDPVGNIANDPFKDDFYEDEDLVWNQYQQNINVPPTAIGQHLKHTLRNSTARTGTGADINSLLMLHDTPGPWLNHTLDFEVRLVYRTTNLNVHIGPGFNWQQTNAGIPARTFTGYLANPSNDFIDCMTRCIRWENDVKRLGQHLNV